MMAMQFRGDLSVVILRIKFCDGASKVPEELVAGLRTLHDDSSEDRQPHERRNRGFDGIQSTYRRSSSVHRFLHCRSAHNRYGLLRISAGPTALE
jgi:hypothetical protein